MKRKLRRSRRDKKIFRKTAVKRDVWNLVPRAGGYH